jgi:transcription elongation factor Elf1
MRNMWSTPALEKLNMGRRRKKVVRVPRRRLPKRFSCPKCGKETVSVEIRRDEALASVRCGSCGLKDDFPIKHAQAEIDAYCMFTDKIYGVSKKPSAVGIEST